MNKLSLALVPLFAVSAFASSPRIYTEQDFAGDLKVEKKTVEGKKCLFIKNGSICDGSGKREGQASEYVVTGVPALNAPVLTAPPAPGVPGVPESSNEEQKCKQNFVYVPGAPPETASRDALCNGVANAAAALEMFRQGIWAGMTGFQAADVVRNAPAPAQAIACYPGALADSHDTGIALNLCRNTRNAAQTRSCYNEKMRTLQPPQTAVAVQQCTQG